MIEPPVIKVLAARDIRVWATGDRLRIDAPGGSLTPELRAKLAEAKPEILAFLRGPGRLSYSQERLWVLDQIEPGSATYVIPVALHLRGALRVDALSNALNALVVRHEALRTTFHEVNGTPVQLVEDPAPIALPVVDLTQTPDRLAASMRAEAARGFDLSVGPLFRAVLYQLGPDDHVLLLVQHHTVSDAWSMSVLQSELGILYGAEVNGTESSLPDLPIRYVDYARWQRSSLHADEKWPQEDYWRSRLSGAPQVLELPIDEARPPMESHRGAAFSFDVPSALSGELSALARREGITLFMLLLGAFEALLWRYTGQEDFLIGTAVAGRNREELEGLIGLFVNTLVLRGDLSANPTVRQHLARVREECLGAFANEDLPFEQLMKQMRPDRDLSRNPIFQVMFVLQSAPAKPFEAAGLSVSTETVDRGAAQLDLTLSVQETPTGLRGTFEYATDLFERETIARMSGHFSTLLEGFVRQPDRPIAALPMLTAGERDGQRAWNATTVPVSDACMHELFAKQAERVPTRVALEFKGSSLTYAELDARSNRVAERLQACGVAPGVLVGVFVERSLEMVIGLLGVLKAGGAYMPLDPGFPGERLAFMIEDSGAAVLLSTTASVDSAPNHTLPVVLVDSEGGDSPAVPESSALMARPEDLAYVIYTSGSTGRPKGVAVPHRALVNMLESMAREPGFTETDVVLSVTTLSFDIAALELYLPLIQGGRIVLASRDEASDGQQLMAKLSSSGATVMQATPATWRLLIESGWTGATRLKVLCGGEAMPRELAEGLLPRVGELWNVYGPTETTVWSSAGRVSANAGPVLIGRPIANTQIWVLGGEYQPMPIGVPGELYIAGAGLADGYWNRASLTSERFVPNPMSDDPGARMYRTGDLARWTADGRLECLGRIDDQVKLRGFRIELGEIETVIAEVEGVSGAVVMVRRGSDGNDRLVAYVAHGANSPVESTVLREQLERRVPAYMVPSIWIAVETFPLTPNGKVNRKALAQLELAPIRDASSLSAPGTQTEAALAKIWQSVLELPAVGMNENFFMSGGNSLSAVRLMAQIRTSFQVDIGLRTLFERPTVANLADAIDELVTATDAANPEAAGPRSIVPLKADGSRTPLFVIPGHGGDVFCFIELARHINADQPMLGVQPPGLEGSEPLRSIPELASYAVRQIRQVQPTGPYLLAGYCAGGTVAFEIANQLVDAGQHVAMLTLFGSAYPATYRKMWSTIRVATYYTARVRYHLVNAFGEGIREGISYLHQRFLRGGWAEANIIANGASSTTPETRRLEDATLAGIRAYSPRRFAGELDVFMPSKAWRKGGSQPDRWKSLARTLHLHMVPDECHLDDMLRGQYVAGTAALYNRRLDEVAMQLESAIASVEAASLEESVA